MIVYSLAMDFKLRQFAHIWSLNASTMGYGSFMSKLLLEVLYRLAIGAGDCFVIWQL